jgi:hypothetical protein
MPASPVPAYVNGSQSKLVAPASTLYTANGVNVRVPDQRVRNGPLPSATDPAGARPAIVAPERLMPGSSAMI